MKRALVAMIVLGMVGFALEATTPFAGLGGEPIKAMLLKRHYGVAYREATASLILARTTDLAGQLVFVLVGLALILTATNPALDALPYRQVAGSGVAAMVAFVVLLVLAQRGRALARLRAWLVHSRLGRRVLPPRAVTALGALRAVEDRLAAYYAVESGRCAVSLALAVADWVLGACAIYLSLALLGHPVSLADAVVVESFVAIVRSALFMVPADLGTQEGAFVLICGALTGSPESGLALAAILRARTLVWIVWGFALAGWYSLWHDRMATA